MPLPLEQAEAKAKQIVACLAAACDDILVAGSIRRRKAEVKDIEIVARSRFLQRDLFGSPNWDAGTELGLLIDDLVRRKALIWDEQVPRNGQRYKRLIVVSVQTPLDLFITDEHNFGNMVAIRTGDADFSQQLVTPLTMRGLMPAGHKQHEGYLWKHANWERVSCPTEAAFFAALGLRERDIPAPEDRTAEVVASLREKIKRGAR